MTQLLLTINMYTREYQKKNGDISFSPLLHGKFPYYP
jgi:hypothetical protein